MTRTIATPAPATERSQSLLTSPKEWTQVDRTIPAAPAPAAEWNEPAAEEDDQWNAPDSEWNEPAAEEGNWNLPAFPAQRLARR